MLITFDVKSSRVSLSLSKVYFRRSTENPKSVTVSSKRVVRVQLPYSFNQAPLHESTFFEFLCGILTSKYVAEAHLSLLFPYVKNSWKKPETNVTSFAAYVFVSKFNNASASISNTTYRCGSCNVFTSLSTRTRRLMYSRVVQPVRVVYCIHKS